MKGILKNRSVYQQFGLLAGVTVLVLGLLLSIAVYWVRLNVQKQSETYLKNSAAQLETVVQQNYTTCGETMRLISYNNDIQAFLLAEKKASRVGLYSNLKQSLTAFASLNSQILDIVILDNHGYRYGLGDNLVYPLPERSERSDGPVVSDQLKINSGNTQVSYLVMAQEIYSTSNYVQTSEKIGSLYLILSPNVFAGSEKTADFEGESLLFLSDSVGNVLWSNSADATQEAFDQIGASEQKNSQLHISLEKPAFQITAYQNAALLLGSNERESFLLICFCATIVLLSLIWILWAKNLVTPLVRLTRFTEDVCKSDLSALSQRVSLTGYREATVLSADINHMLEQIAELTETVIEKNGALYKSQILVKQSELIHLRSQINPHFLYNTLETMVGIAYTEGLPQIAEIARALSLIFKYTVKGGDTVPLQNELKIAKSYILIQGIRFEGRFETCYQIDQDCLQDIVPKMILQPLIENAIVHGIEQQQEHCRLTISAQRQGGSLIITVRDDGSGISAGELEHIRENLRREHTGGEPAHHIGMQNVHERIRLMYGEEYGLSVNSDWGKGTTIRLELPVMAGEKGAEANVSGNDC